LHPRPWHKNKVVLIGDAAHATTPHLASGAGIGVEDALVLAQELERSDDLDAALSSFMDRRFERCRIVIENSVRLGELESNGNREEEHSQLMRTTFAALHAPI
jgi:2-polyprenyl-6-methoxyphenol hydroxylase-like FAD-dependent oxidoreductase